MQGLNGGWPLDDHGNYDFQYSLYQQIPLLVAAGAKAVRLNFRLGAQYSDWTTPDSRNITALRQYDVVVDALLKAGLSILGLLSNESWRGNQVAWCANSVELGKGNGDNPYVQAFSINAAVVLTKYFAGRIAAWEVWNEPNAYTRDPHTDAPGGSFLQPSNFAWLLHHVYNDTRAAGVNRLLFVSGGVFANQLGMNLPDNAGATYLTNTYKQGLDNANWATDKEAFGSYPLDAIGQHLYIGQGGLIDANTISDFLLAARNAYAVFEGEDSFKLMMITEIGWTTASVDKDMQATNLTAAYNATSAMSFVDSTFWFAVQDIPPASLWYGLYDEKGAAKPALQAFSSLL